MGDISDIFAILSYRESGFSVKEIADMLGEEDLRVIEDKMEIKEQEQLTCTGRAIWQRIASVNQDGAQKHIGNIWLPYKA